MRLLTKCILYHLLHTFHYVCKKLIHNFIRGRIIPCPEPCCRCRCDSWNSQPPDRPEPGDQPRHLDLNEKTQVSKSVHFVYVLETHYNKTLQIKYNSKDKYMKIVITNIYKG